MTPEQEAQQKAHADAIAARTEDRRLTPPERAHAALEANIRRIVREEFRALMAGFTIQGGGSVHTSGTGFNITVTGDQVLPRVLQGSAQCEDDGSITITLQG